MHWDLVLFNAIHRFWGVSRFWDALGVFCADTLTYFLAIGGFVFVFRIVHSGRQRLFVAGEMLLAFLIARGILASIISYLVQRLRPFAALDFTPPFLPLTSGSFPSGHMSGLFAVAFVIFAFDGRWGLVFMALSLVVGLARIFTGLHWPSDILAGLFLGIASGYLVHMTLSPSRQALMDLSSAKR